MSKRFDICTPRKKKDGGTYWVKIGTAWEGDKGTQLVFDALPIPDNEGRVVANLFEPRNDASRNDRTGQAVSSRAELDDEIPF
jgi:hypothetical protein